MEVCNQLLELISISSFPHDIYIWRLLKKGTNTFTSHLMVICY